MHLKTKIKKTWNIIKNPRMIFCSTKYIILFSHMRSRSSVMSHIMGTNNEIVGYGERTRSYLSNLDLFKMRVDLNADTQKNICNKFLYDKLLHNSLRISEKNLKNEKFKFIFLLREPESSIKSTIDMGFKVNVKNYQSEEFVCKYYIERLRELEKYALALKGRYFFIESDQLIDDADKTLNEVSNWLSLKEPLSKKYETFKKTGTPKHGDPSENIHSGILKRTKKHAIQLDPELLHQARVAYQSCLKTLTENAAS